MKSCDTCPAFIPPDQVAVKLGKNTGTAMCGRYGKVLGNPQLDPSGLANLWEFTALSCDAYGKDAPEKPERWDTQVAHSDPSIPLAVTGEELQTCRGCTHLVRSQYVYEEMGYPNDLCRATGKLILRPQFDCKGCPFATAGMPQTTTAGVEMMEQYRPGFTIPTEKAVAYVFSKGKTDVDPNEYPSDFPVSAEDEAAGIRAWRQVEPGDNGIEPVAIPVFRHDLFTDEERILIPQTGDDTMPDLYVDHQNLLFEFAANCYALGEVLALEGEPGTGKTQFANFAAWTMQLPFVLFQFDEETMVDDMLGKMGIDNEDGVSVTKFKPGRITKWIPRPGLCTYDEYNVAENAIKQALRTRFNGSPYMNIDRGDIPIRIEASPYNFNVVCQNPSWDMRNIGTKQMGGADMDRLSPVHVELPPESIERHIIIERCAVDGYKIPESRLDLIMKIAADLREYSKQDTVPFTFGIRQSIKVARKTRYLKVPAAFYRAVLDFYDPEVREICQGVINTYVQ